MDQQDVMDAVTRAIRSARGPLNRTMARAARPAGDDNATIVALPRVKSEV